MKAKYINSFIDGFQRFLEKNTWPENEGMFFGFWAGEILRGLGLYLQVQNNII